MKALRWIAGLLLALALIAGVVAIVADSSAGHRYLIDRIEALRPANGLRIRIGRIDGSIYRRARITGLRLADPKGVFFEAGDVAIAWSPFAYLRNRLDMDTLTAPTGQLYRLPQLVPSTRPGPILPAFDIRIGRLRIDRLSMGAGRTARLARATASADVAGGRARVALDIRSAAGDRIVLALDSAPDRDVFDVGATIVAPATGAIAALTGLKQPLSARVEGNGRWTDWHGALVARLGTRPLAHLALAARSGRYDLTGTVVPALVTSGRTAALLGPAMRVTGNARLDQRRLDTHLAVASPALALTANGVVDLAQGGFDAMRLDARLLRPQAALPSLSGRDIALRVLLDGPFATAVFDYALTAPHIAFDATGIDDVRVVGRGRLSAQPYLVPVRLTARRVTGVGDVAGGILSNLSVDGLLRVTSRLVTGDGLTLRSDKLNGTLAVLLDIASGRYDIGLSGQLTRYLIPGLGIVDVKSVLNVVPGTDGQGVRVVGRGQVWIRRLDNAFFASLTGGLPVIDTALERTADGLIRFTGLRLRSPALTLAGAGYRRLDGSFFFEGGGQQARYGPLRLRIDGPVTRPKVDLFLARPFPAAGLRDVTAHLQPTAQGFDWSASGASMAGRFAGTGAILLGGSGGATVVRIARLAASGIVASGDLRLAGGAVAGRLALLGGGLDGSLLLGSERGFQRVEAHVTARDVKLVGPPLLVVQRGRLDAVAVLDPRGTSVDATFVGQGLRRGDIALSRLAANARLTGGVGEVRAAFAGARGRGFDVQTVAQVSPDRIVVRGQGTVDRQPLTLANPAVLTRERDGWRLATTTLGFAGGNATVAGRFGGAATDIDATVERMPLTVLDIAAPTLGLGGSASGRIAFHQPANGATPTGSATLRVRNLTRAGLVLVSKPVDAGVNLLLDGAGLAVRAIAASDNRTIGQAQLRIAPLGQGGSLAARLANGALFAQLRYNGPADTAWRLTGIESFDVSGPVAVGADVTGTLGDPRIRGSVMTAGLRVESPVAGTVLTGLKASGRFDASRLVIDRFDAVAGRGSVSGRAVFDLAAANGFGIDVSLDAREAALIARDDFAATVTGPLHIVSDGGTGTISGNVALDRGAFRLGRATAAQQVPVLKVREINRPAGSPRIRAAPTLWTLDVKARADDRLAVTGLGLDSEWRADLALSGTLDAPRILGRAEVVRGGYEFAGKRFELQRGIIRFQGAFPPDPVVDIVANANIQAIAATITVTGTAQRPEISFASTPALPQDELLSRLLFGTSITNLSAPEALQRCSSPRSGRCAAAAASTRSTRCARRSASTGCASFRPMRASATRPRSRSANM